MQHLLQSSTDLAVHAIFDPEAMLHVINDAQLEEIHEDQLAPDLERGNALLYSWGSDGGSTFQVFVDEEPGPDLVQRGSNRLTSALLHAPSGRLCAAGIEALCRPGKRAITAEEFVFESKDIGSCIPIPPGDYIVDAFEAGGAPSKDVGPVLGCRSVYNVGARVTIVGSALIGAAALVSLVLGARWWRVSFIWLAWLPLFWLLLWGLNAWRNTRSFPVRSEDAPLERPFDAVIVLRRADASADGKGLRGGRFGPGYAIDKPPDSDPGAGSWIPDAMAGRG